MAEVISGKVVDLNCSMPRLSDSRTKAPARAAPQEALDQVDRYARFRGNLALVAAEGQALLAIVQADMPRLGAHDSTILSTMRVMETLADGATELAATMLKQRDAAAYLAAFNKRDVERRDRQERETAWCISTPFQQEMLLERMVDLQGALDKITTELRQQDEELGRLYNQTWERLELVAGVQQRRE
ncbi:uncharacterized protein LY79DRAFT_584984 [Colletotrichum navitas]|uniref:Uncharacterized protein n=1 Tax=Colletotrichum navitas TaxID=681940 RepID=A0AAD8UYK4_9PEZI|nr:uncharacterized protein LY79DRAFT_584984 [Colletotrichum navitas]KAK1566135.1 hypothetical protein LY79DRAFT_584984 [Colletotrichum navitas]